MIIASLTFLVTRFACGEFFGLKPWNQYINGGACGDINVTPDKLPGLVPLIALAVLDDLLRIAGVAAVAFVIYGAIQYITSQGSPDATKAAQSTIINALVGVVITMIGASLVAYIGHRVGA